MKLPVFASVLNDQIAHLGIAEACKVLNISRRTLESWRYGKPPRMVIQVGALAILADAQARWAKRQPKSEKPTSEIQDLQKILDGVRPHQHQPKPNQQIVK